MEQYGEDHPYTAFPPVDGFEYLTTLFVDAGIATQGGMNISPLSWQELHAFDACNSLELNAWEFSRLMDMSKAYCNWNSKGNDQSDIADDVPYIERERSATSYLIKQREISKKNAEKPLI